MFCFAIVGHSYGSHFLLQWQHKARLCKMIVVPSCNAISRRCCSTSAPQAAWCNWRKKKPKQIADNASCSSGVKEASFLHKNDKSQRETFGLSKGRVRQKVAVNGPLKNSFLFGFNDKGKIHFPLAKWTRYCKENQRGPFIYLYNRKDSQNWLTQQKHENEGPARNCVYRNYLVGNKKFKLLATQS